MIHVCRDLFSLRILCASCVPSSVRCFYRSLGARRSVMPQPLPHFGEYSLSSVVSHHAAGLLGQHVHTGTPLACLLLPQAVRPTAAPLFSLGRQAHPSGLFPPPQRSGQISPVTMWLLAGDFSSSPCGSLHRTYHYMCDLVSPEQGIQESGRHWGRNCNVFYKLISEVTWRYFCRVLLVTQTSLGAVWKGRNSGMQRALGPPRSLAAVPPDGPLFFRPGHAGRA